MMDNQIDRELLEKIADMLGKPVGAFNIRKDCGCDGRESTENIQITDKTDKPGIDIRIKDGTVGETCHIPVIITQSGLNEMVYNDFFIGENCDVEIVAGCGIHNCGDQDSAHDGIHTFHVGKNAKVRYIEKHYGEGDGNGRNIMNPTSVIELAEGAYMEMETAQIKGVDSTDRTTRAKLAAKATLIVREKLMTHGEQVAKTYFEIDLNGEDCGTHVISRSVARDKSKQIFVSHVNGNSVCSGHTECDAIIMDGASVSAVPEIMANHPDASLIHEAAIGKIAGEQLIKLMTLGLTEKEAEEQIIGGFLK